MSSTTAQRVHVAATSMGLRVRDWSFPGEQAFAVYSADDTFMGVVAERVDGSWGLGGSGRPTKADKAALLALCKAIAGAS